MKEGLLEVDWDDERQDFTFADTNGGRALLELLPTPSWHELQYRPMTVPAGTRSSCRRTWRRSSRSTPRSRCTGSSRSARSRSSSSPWRSRPLAPLVRAQAVGVVLFATVGEVTGSLVWGVYHYRLHNLPLFIPPAHGLVYLSGIALSRSLRARAVVWAAAVGAAAWGIAGLTVLPRLDVAGAFGVPLLLVFLWRSRSRAAYAGVFLVVAALELYGTSIGTWRWASTLPGLGIPDGNPPSGVASGYVWFDVMALLVAPWLVYVAGGTLNPKRWTFSSGPLLSSIRRREPIGTMSASGASSSRASVT